MTDRLRIKKWVKSRVKCSERRNKEYGRPPIAHRTKISTFTGIPPSRTDCQQLAPCGINKEYKMATALEKKHRGGDAEMRGVRLDNLY
jgi:hypothetical protein